MTVRDIVLAASGVGGTPPPSSSDPQFNYVSLLLNDTGTNGQQNNTFLDSSSNNFTITRNGTPTQGSVTPYWPDGQWSNYFGGTGNYLSFTGVNAAFQFGTGDWTVECWVCPNTVNTDNYVWDFRPTSNGAYPALNASSTGFKYVANSAVRITSTTVPQIGQWYHVAVSRSGTSTKLFVNGVQEGVTYTDSTNYTVASNRPYIGIDGFGAATPFIGYISNVRMVKGTAVYTSNFTPSTTPLTAISGTSLLTCQSNRFKDNSSNNFAITVTGTPTVQAFEPFEPTASYDASTYGGSGYYGGTGQGTRLADSTAFDLAGGAYTIEFWVNPTSYTTEAILVGQNDYGTTGEWDIRVRTTGNIRVAYNSTGAATIDSLAAIPRTAWTHVAVVDDGTQTILYVNGIRQGTSATRISNSTRNLGIGCASNFNAPLTGFLSNVRIVKGTAVYSGTSFTLPTAPVTAISGTSLLMNYANAGIYDAAVLNDLTTIGDAKVSTAQAKWGGSSMAFDGTGDWLTFVDNPSVQVGTGDFTVEAWVYLSTTTGAYQYFVSKGTSTTGWSLAVNASGNLALVYSNGATLTSTGVINTGAWYHVAVVRSGSATGNVKLFINGVLDTTSGTAITDNFNQTSIGYVGASRTGAAPLNGYIEDLRITKGYARYSTTFTPPTAAFPTR